MEGGKVTRDQAVNDIARRYREFVQAVRWLGQRIAFGGFWRTAMQSDAIRNARRTVPSPYQNRSWPPCAETISFRLAKAL